MTRSLQNLERLCQKMQARYGQQDPLVQQLFHELLQVHNQSNASPPRAGNYRRCFLRHSTQVLHSLH